MQSKDDQYLRVIEPKPCDMKNLPSSIHIQRSILCIVLLLFGCSNPEPDPPANPLPTRVAKTPTRTQTAAATTPPTPLSISTEAIATPTMDFSDETIFDLCSPLAGVPLNEIVDTIVNPFNPPRTSSDDPHQGIDLAELKGNPRIAVAGLEVHSATSGKVAAIIDGSFPYGYAVMIETALENITEEWKLHLPLPTPDSMQPYISPLSCPEEYDLTFESETEERAIYLLYAHMAEPPSYRIGEDVTCGQLLGQIGSSGNALNPHLHLETRIGPANMRFAGMAHYDTRATAHEMGNYCLWRVSGKFHLIDPTIILVGTEE